MKSRCSSLVGLVPVAILILVCFGQVDKCGGSEVVERGRDLTVELGRRSLRIYTDWCLKADGLFTGHRRRLGLFLHPSAYRLTL